MGAATAKIPPPLEELQLNIRSFASRINVYPSKQNNPLNATDISTNSYSIVYAAYLPLLLPAEGRSGEDLEYDPGSLGSREEALHVVAPEEPECTVTT